MATAGRSQWSSSSHSSNENNAMVTKYPIKRLEISIKKFIKVLSIDLDRLHKHSVNLKRYTHFEDWQGLDREQINATRTVQQIKSNIKEIEKARSQVNDEDKEEFDRRVLEVKQKAVTSVDEFMFLLDAESASEVPSTNNVNGQRTEIGTGDFQPTSLSASHFSSPSLPPPPPQRTSSSSSSKYVSPAPAMSQSTYTPSTSTRRLPTHPWDDSTDIYASLDTALLSTNNETSVSQAPLLTTNLHVVPQNSEALASFEQLRESIDDLNDMVHVFAENVEGQQEAIDHIENNINSAHIDVQEGTSYLARASKYKVAMFPAVGAVIGGVVGGPVGLLAGAKLGGLAAGIGGVVGFAGGRFLKKRQNKITEMEMAKMSYSMYIPDLSSDNTAEPDTAFPEDAQGETPSTNASAESSEQSFGSSVKEWFGLGSKE